MKLTAHGRARSASLLRFRAIIAVTAMVSLAAACGDDDDDSGSPATSPPSSAAPTETTAGSGDSSDTTAAPDDSAEWDAIVEAANDEGAVVLYMSIPGYEEKVKAAWSEAYPDIELTIVRAASAELISKLDQEKATGSPGADVAFHSTFPWYQDNIADLVPAAGPAVDAWDGTDYAVDRTIFTAILNPFVVGYNTQVLDQIGADPIETWEDTLQPELGGGLFATSDMSISKGMVSYYYQLESAFPGYWEKVAELDPRFYESTGPAAQALAAGEHAISLHQSVSAMKPLMDEGAPIEWVLPTDAPLMGTSYPLAVVGWAEHPNAAQVLANWLLAEDGGQLVLHGDGQTASPIFDIPGQIDIPDGMKINTGILSSEEEAFEPTWYETMGR